MVKKDFCIKTMKNEGMNCFIIYDKDMNMVARQIRNVSHEDAEAALNDFFENAESGLYTVRIFAFKDLSKSGQPVQGKYILHDIHHVPSLKEKEPLPPVPGYSGAGGLGAIHEQTNSWIDRFLGGKDEITGLRLELEKDRIRNEYEQKMREMEAEHKRAMAEKENRWEERIMGIASTVAPDLLKGFMGGKPINGISATDETETNTEQMTNNSDAKTRIIAAINTLSKLDPNLAENLEKLAKLAKNNPEMYKQAVQMLKSFS
jgi:hypothetical protein